MSYSPQCITRSNEVFMTKGCDQATHVRAQSARAQAPRRFDLCDERHRCRRALETYIANEYEAAFGARITEFLPVLLTLSDSSGWKAAVGMRSAAYSDLFLEQYLPTPVEQAIANTAKLPVDRNSVVEIGNLVATGRGTSQLLFIVMAAALERAGYCWLVFTATPQVEKLVKRLQCEPLFLAAAQGECLGESQMQWGTYYGCKPKAMAGRLTQALALGRRNRAVAQVLDTHAELIAELAGPLRAHRLQESVA